MGGGFNEAVLSSEVQRFCTEHGYLVPKLSLLSDITSRHDCHSHFPSWWHIVQKNKAKAWPNRSRRMMLQVIVIVKKGEVSCY